MKKKIFIIIAAAAALLSCFCSVRADAEYMTAEDARYFLAFIYNADADHVTEEALADDIFYEMLIGEYSNNSEYELAAKAAFLSHMDARIIDTLEKADAAVHTSREYLINYFSENLDEDSTGLVTDIYKENVAGSILKLCGGDGIMELVDAVTNVKENPEKYLDDVKAVSSAFTYAYGQNVASLYTYFDTAMSNMYLKNTEGAYETAMAYTVLALKESNFMSFAAKLIPGIASWEDWIDKMDYWAEFAYNMKGEVSAGNSSDFKIVVYHPNCEELEVKTLWYTGGQLYAPAMERERYVLQGWYFDEECTAGPVKNDYVPTEKVVYLYAKWEPRYFIMHFDSNCEEVSDYTYELDRLNVNWHEPVMKRGGYIFNGWYWDSECSEPVDGEFTVAGDMTFYAGWISQYGYTVSNNKATISYIKNWDKDENGNNIYDIIIPEKINGYSVEAVNLKYDANAITGITFPNSMTNIKEWSFSRFSNLKKVVLSDSIQTIEEGAFARSYEIKSVVFGNGLKTIGSEAFTECANLTEISLPNGLITIDDYAFSGCGVTELSLPDSVEMVGDRAFSGCKSLKTVEIGRDMESISGSAFEGSDAIESISVSDDNSYYTSDDGVLYSKDKTVLIKYPSAKKLISFNIPQTVTEIADSAFYGCTSLENIDISNVRIIGANAFKDCKNLTFVDLSNAYSIGERAFSGCEKLKAVNMPNTLDELKHSTFYECASLEEITIPHDVAKIGFDCFTGCISLSSISLPDSVEVIDEYAFSGCKKLSYVKLPSGITEITSGLFSSCESLEKAEIPKQVTSIGYGAFSGCKSLKNIDIPTSVTYINACAFSNCSGLEKIVIPNGISMVSYMTFSGCTSLKKIVIPSSITYIDFSNFDSSLSDAEVYFTGTKEQWNGVEINESGNDYLIEAYVICGNKVIAELCNVKRDGKTIRGEAVYDFISEASDVLAALYKNGTFVKMCSFKAEKDSDKTDIEIACDDESYEMKVFFWDFADLMPKGKSKSVNVQ